MMNHQVFDFIDKNNDSFLGGLKELIRVESVSSQPAHKKDILKCAELEAQKFKEVGLKNVRLLETKGNPLVYGDWLHAKQKPTLLIYGHYDVQPPDPLDQWKTPPFEPTVRNGNLYGRGTTDNKGQHFSHLCAIEAWLKTIGKLPINIKVVLEGEEEIGSVSISEFVASNSKIFACDAVLISDMPWFDFDRPSIAYALKGLAYFEVKVRGPSHDLHSGLFGGMIRNPAQALSWMLAKLKNEKEKILIPGFYDDVETITPEERKNIQNIPFNPKALLKETGASDLVSEEGFGPVEHNWTRPTLDICGIWGGYQGVGAKTIIPAEAFAKVSMRLVPHQDPKKIEKQFGEYLQSLCPRGVSVSAECFKGGKAVAIDRHHPYLRKVAGAYEEGFGKKIVFTREGASIPVCEAFFEVLKVPIILIGLGLPDDRLHSPNEKISLTNFFDGIKGAALAYQALGETKK
ncbi:MAG: dipeptidase [Deltaproteobacteria bacterium]|nr:dipeptidase [Deltaproteobacteria bacterium]